MSPSKVHRLGAVQESMAEPAQRSASKLANSAGYAFEVVDVSKEFPGVRALRGVTVQAFRGELHCLVGENGAGKSTLVKILNGIYPAGAYAGQLRLRGEEVRFRSPHDAQRQGIGYVPQEISVIEQLTVAENIFVGALADGRWLVMPRAFFRRAEQLLAEIGLALDPRQAVSALNASQRQLVMIARALSLRPSVLILDEPTSALTQEECAHLFAAIRQLRTRGATVLFITHKLGEVEALADRVTVLRDGQVAAQFARGEFTQSDLIAGMIGRKLEALFPARPSSGAGAELLRAEDLTVPHPRLAARNLLENINFSIRCGEIVGLAGVVGAGRSELANALYGRYPYLGRIFVHGRLTRLSHPRAAKKAGIGLVTEDRKIDGLLLNFSVRSNVTLGALAAVSRFGVVRRRRENSVAADYRERFSIRAPSLQAAAATLSGGNQQKVILSKVLLARPAILLLDEPTKGVDVGAKHEIYRLMAHLAGQGLGILFISSEWGELLGMCDRFIVLAAGRIQDQFSKAEASEARLLRAACHGGAPP